jgi:hypothetical protein
MTLVTDASHSATFVFCMDLARGHPYLWFHELVSRALDASAPED